MFIFDKMGYNLRSKAAVQKDNSYPKMNTKRKPVKKKKVYSKKREEVKIYKVNEAEPKAKELRVVLERCPEADRLARLQLIEQNEAQVRKIENYKQIIYR